MDKTPTGEAGSDQIDAMIESINGQLETMLVWVAKGDLLEYGVGRAPVASGPDDRIRLKSQRRECDANIMFHAGRALEISLNVLYARVANRIPGREYPGMSESEIEKVKKDRSSHRLSDIYKRIRKELKKRGEKIEDVAEDVYQTALHKGVVDVISDGKRIQSYMQPDDIPFREKSIGGWVRGAEVTLDHLKDNWSSLILRPEGLAYSIPRTFNEFMREADGSHYGQNMIWARYASRDSEMGRPYMIIGTRFFCRLIKGMVELSSGQWTWHPDLVKRWNNLRRRNVIDLMKTLASQNLEGEVDWPPEKSIAGMVEMFTKNPTFASEDQMREHYNNMHSQLKVTIPSHKTSDE